MVTLNIIREQYAKMPDEELIHFAKNESQHLTIESFRLLLLEFKNRNLDIGILESVEVDKELEKLNIQTSFEKKTSQDIAQAMVFFCNQNCQFFRAWRIYFYDCLVR